MGLLAAVTPLHMTKRPLRNNATNGAAVRLYVYYLVQKHFKAPSWAHYSMLDSERSFQQCGEPLAPLCELRNTALMWYRPAKLSSQWTWTRQRYWLKSKLSMAACSGDPHCAAIELNRIDHLSTTLDCLFLWRL
jgi:hypothetical protein